MEEPMMDAPMNVLEFPQQLFDNLGAQMNHEQQQNEILLDDSGEQYPNEFSFDGDVKPDVGPRAVHQCNICNKIFVTFKGLQQHAIIHTDQKPFVCEICNKAFRFKSNLFEHRSVHSGFNPHTCPYCGKTCRLKGNLKKHLKTHVTDPDELAEAWKPFASNRRPPAEVPADAIIVRSNGDGILTPVIKPRKRKLGLGLDARLWIDKVRRGEILPTETVEQKLAKFRESLQSLTDTFATFKTLLDNVRNIPFENFECPICKAVFPSRGECSEHLDLEHPLARVERPMFCEICLKAFSDRKSMEQHESYHKRVHLLVESGELELHDPELLAPQLGNNFGSFDAGDAAVKPEVSQLHQIPPFSIPNPVEIAQGILGALANPANNNDNGEHIQEQIFQ